jgi:hypothetical protein
MVAWTTILILQTTVIDGLDSVNLDYIQSCIWSKWTQLQEFNQALYDKRFFVGLKKINSSFTK